MNEHDCSNCDIVDLLLAVNLYKAGAYQLTVDDLNKMRDVIDNSPCSNKVKEYFSSVISLVTDADLVA